MQQGRYLFISDLHLDASLPAAIARFRAFLAAEARECDGLYILGDLFESWIGDDDDDPARREVCDALRALTAAGIACRVQHGNRDFLLGRGFSARTGCELIADPATLEAGGRRFVISHGDQLCTLDVAYQRFRRVVRSPALQGGWRMLPLKARRGLAGGIRRGSSSHTRRKPQPMMDVSADAVQALLRATGAEVLIHGHTHRPGEHALRVDGRACTRIVLGDWYEQGSVLELTADGRTHLRTLAQDEFRDDQGARA